MEKVDLELSSLSEAILLLKSSDEVSKFMEDLLTGGELIEMQNRWIAAQQLAREVPYTQIEKRTGLSSTTIARVSKWLRNGSGGYKLVLGRMSKGRHF